MKLVQTNIYGEIFTHKYLWECCLRQMDTAKRRKKGQLYFHTTAMLMAYLTYEAYINFVGDRVAKDIWKNERDFFSKGKYRGIEGKLNIIKDKCRLTGISKGKRPYQTIIKLNKLRDFLCHCKPDTYEKKIIHTRDKEPPLFGKYGKLDALVSEAKAKMAITDVKDFIESIHNQAANHTQDVWFGEGKDALGGITRHSFSDTRLNT